MPKTITLNEQQLNLLREFISASDDRRKRHELLADSAKLSPMIAQNTYNYNTAFQNYTMAVAIEDGAARVFASSVAAELGTEVAHG